MIRDEPNATYHANPAVSHSKLETFRRRPALYYKRYILQELHREPASTAFRFGSAAHAMVLEPATWGSRYAIKPEGIDRRTKEGKALYAELEAKAAGKVMLDFEESVQVIELTKAVRNHPLAAELLAAGEPELVWRNEGKLALQCRTDWFNPAGCSLSEGRPYVVDLKTVESLDDGAFGHFEKAVFRYGYHRQAGFYLPLITEVLGQPVYDFFFIAAEKVQPFGVAVYRLTDEAVACGQDETMSDLSALYACIQSNVWPNIEATLHHLGLPKWYAKGGEA